MQDHSDDVYGDGKISENKLYFVTNDNKRIFVKSGVDQPSNSKSVARATMQVDGKQYQGYESEDFFKDCLHTAEEIINSKQLQTKKGPEDGVFSKVEATGTDFGVGDNENIAAAEASQLDALADPGVLQAYVIVNTQWAKNNDDPYPYHAAAVVAADGDDRITLEVFASNRNAAVRNTKGAYRIYSTTTNTQTFHEVWKPAFKNKTATTVIVKKS